MGRGQGAGRLSAGSYGGRGGNVKMTTLVDKIVNIINSVEGFVMVPLDQRMNWAADISATTGLGDTFTIGQGSPIVKSGSNQWKNGNSTMGSLELLGMIIDGANMGMKTKFKRKK